MQLQLSDHFNYGKLLRFTLPTNLYRSAFAGMIANVATIIVAFLLVLLNICPKANDLLVKIEITTLIVGIVFFAWCIKHLIFVISKLKNNK